MRKRSRGMLGRMRPLLLVLTLLWPLTARAYKTIRLTFTGDVTLGSEEDIRAEKDSLDALAKEKGYDYFFEKVRPLFEQDDLTIVNLEGVLSDSSEGENTKKTYRFRGPADFAEILARGSVEMANLANNHTLDYGERGYRDTRQALDAAGVAHFGREEAALFEKDGVKIAFFGLSYSEMSLKKREQAARQIERMREEEGVNAVVFVFHAGREYSECRTEKQFQYARFAVDAGADLVIMHHPHVVQGISVLDGRSVCYSLGNFCFGGNRRVRALESLIVAAELTFADDGTYKGQQLTLYPAHVSGDASRNDFQPRLVSGRAARRVMRLVQADTRFELVPYEEAAGCAVQAYLPAE
jgi:hypothetical protein